MIIIMWNVMYQYILDRAVMLKFVIELKLVSASGNELDIIKCFTCNIESNIWLVHTVVFWY